MVATKPDESRRNNIAKESGGKGTEIKAKIKPRAGQRVGKEMENTQAEI